MKKVWLLGLMILSSGASAEVVSKRITIDDVWVDGDGTFKIYSKYSLNNNCYSNDRQLKVYYHSSDMTEKGIDRTLSLVLTAQTINKPIVVYFENNSRNCWVKSVKLES